MLDPQAKEFIQMTAFHAPDLGLFIAIDRNGQAHYRRTAQEAQDEAEQVTERIEQHEHEQSRKLALALEWAGANLNYR